MKYILITFRSRTELMSLFRTLDRRNIPCNLINTPHKIASGCSLSIKTQYLNYANMIDIINRNHYSTLIGVYIIEKQYYGEQITKIM